MGSISASVHNAAVVSSVHHRGSGPRRSSALHCGRAGCQGAWYLPVAGVPPARRPLPQLRSVPHQRALAGHRGALHRKWLLPGRPRQPVNYNVDKIIKHPYYSSYQRGFPNDIALLHLAKDADTSSPYIATIAMAEKGEDFVGNSECYITGWGALYGYGPAPNTLQEAHIGVFTQDQCRAKHGYSVGDYHICVGVENSKGACNGDSGGPLACKVNGKWKLAGATSWGRTGCSTYYPT